MHKRALLTPLMPPPQFTKLADLNKQQYTDTAKFIAGYLSKNKEYKLWQIFSPKNGKVRCML